MPPVWPFLLLILVPANSWVMPLLGAGAGVYLFVRGFLLLQRKRLILNTPVSKIRSAAMGLVEVSGLAAGPYTLTAPITGAPCFYYRTMVWQWKQQGRNSRWVKEADEGLHVPFYLDDGSARVLVDPQGAEMDIHCDFKDEFSQSIFSSSLEIPANISTFLLAHAVDTSKKIKIEEYCIKPKNALFVLGTLATNPGIEVSALPVRTWRAAEIPVSFSIGSKDKFTGAISFGGYRRETTEQPSTPTTDPAQQERIANALTKAGITNPAAWAAAGITQTPVVTAVATGGSAAAAAPAPEQFDLHPQTALMKGSHNPAFFISWKSQREIVNSLAWKSAAMIWCGPAVTLACVYIMAAEFGWL